MSKKLYLFVAVMSLVLGGVLSLPDSIFSSLSGRDPWQQTGLNAAQASSYFSQTSCGGPEQVQLACLWGLEQMGSRLGLQLTLGSDGDLHWIESGKQPSVLKDFIKTWKKHLPQAIRGVEQAFFLITQKLEENKKASSILATGINGILSVQFDPHTYIIPIQVFEENLGSSRRQDVGVGVQVKRVGPSFYINRVQPSSNAYYRGLMNGDKILSINGVSVMGRLSSEVQDLLRGKVDSPVHITVARSAGLFEFLLRREPVEQRSVEKRIFYSGSAPWGLLTISKFTADTCFETKNALIELLETAVGGVVLDLRDNGGGQLDEAKCIADLFLDKGKIIFYTRYFNNERMQQNHVTSTPSLYQGPLTVLVNGSSASASEILAGALQDHGRAVLVGERTFGKGSFQSGQVWDKNDKIALFKTRGLYYLPSGRTSQIQGLIPDVQALGLNPAAPREQDLFSNAIPADSLNDIAGIASLNQVCAVQSSLSDNRHVTARIDFADPQLNRAQDVLLCLKGVGHASANSY